MSDYKVLWFDDEHESFDSIIDDAYQRGITLIGFTNAEEGIAELESNLIYYDAVIVDGKFYKNTQATGDAVNDSALFNVARFLDKIEAKKKIPWFIFSGQPDFLNATNPIAREYKGNKVYNKNFDADIEQLWVDIKKEADQQLDTQIRHKYQPMFEVCTEKYIGAHAGKDLLDLLKARDQGNIENQFNTIRKVIEDIFIGFNKFDLLPSIFVKPNVALNPSSIFLAGAVQGEKTDPIYKQYKHLEETHLPKPISNYLKNILSITQAGSHRSEIDLFVKSIKTPFLFNSVLYQLLDVVVWFKMYVDSNPKTNNWVSVEPTPVSEQAIISNLIKGKVIQKESLARKGKDFAFFMPETKGDNILIPSTLVKLHSLEDDMIIKVEVEEYIVNQSTQLRKKVKRIELL